jgi:hypothetical protein
MGDPNPNAVGFRGIGLKRLWVYLFDCKDWLDVQRLERRRELTHGLPYLLVRGIAATACLSVGHKPLPDDW